MIIYLVCEMNYADFETGLDDNISFCWAYKNKRKAIKKAKELIKNAQKDNLYMDNYISNQKNPFKRNNCVDFYHDNENQDYRVTSIIMEEILIFIGITINKKELRFLDERLKSRVYKYKNKEDLEKKIIELVKQDLERNKEALENE